MAIRIVGSTIELNRKAAQEASRYHNGAASVFIARQQLSVGTADQPENRFVQSLSEELEFEVRNHAQSGFDAADGFLRDLKAQKLELCGELFLGKFIRFPRLPDAFAGDIAPPLIGI